MTSGAETTGPCLHNQADTTTYGEHPDGVAFWRKPVASCPVECCVVAAYGANTRAAPGRASDALVAHDVAMRTPSRYGAAVGKQTAET